MTRSVSSGNNLLLRLVTGSGTAACAGLHAVALVDVQSGRCLFAASAPTDVAADLDLRRAARHQAAILRSQIEAALDMQTSDSAEESNEIEDVLLTMGRQYHLICFVPQREYTGLFLYLVADRAQANLALARRELREIALALVLTSSECEILARLRQTRTGGATSAALQSANFARSTGRPHRDRSDDESSVWRMEDQGDAEEMAEEDLPPFMRTDSVLRLLGISPDAGGTEAGSTP